MLPSTPPLHPKIAARIQAVSLSLDEIPGGGATENVTDEETLPWRGREETKSR